MILLATDEHMGRAARGDLMKLVAERIADEKNVNIHRAKEIIASMTEKRHHNNTYNDNK